MADSIMAGRFHKESCIGRGTFGEAWLVTSCSSGRRYVIKEVRVDAMSEEELEKTRREATILARCKHSSIIRYKEYFMKENPATMCLVMEYADGGDLSLKVKETKKKGGLMAEDDILHWFVQVIFAVQYLHINNILHRDLKTQNVFLTRSNLVKVGDFGIARFLRDRQDLATTSIGTPYYLSPEICMRRPYNHKSDIWAVGCILYELCSLTHPFQAKSFNNLIVSILQGSYKPLPEKFSCLVRDLTRVMLRTNPVRRPTADALLMLPGLKPYVENYLVKHEEILAQRTNAKRSKKEKEECTRDSLRKDELLKDALRIHALKKRGDVESRNSIDLGQIPSRKCSNSGSEESPVFDGKPREKPQSRLGIRPRCSSDPTLERPKTALPVTPTKSNNCDSRIQRPFEMDCFKTPPPPPPASKFLRYKNVKKKRVDTPMPKIVRKIYYNEGEEEEEEGSGRKVRREIGQEEYEASKRQAMHRLDAGVGPSGEPRKNAKEHFGDTYIISRSTNGNDVVD